MKYDEFVDYNDATKYNDTVELMYYFDELGIDPKEAEEAGFGDRYDYLAPRKDVDAVIKYFLVHEEKMKPEGASEEFIKKNFETLFDRYGEKIIDAFSDEAKDRAYEEIIDNPESDDDDFKSRAAPVAETGQTPTYVSRKEMPLDAEMRRLNERFFPGADNRFVAEKNEDTGAYRVMLEWTRGEKTDKHRIAITSEYEDVTKLVSDIGKNADAGTFNHLAEYVNGYNAASKSGDADTDGKLKLSKKQRHEHG